MTTKTMITAPALAEAISAPPKELRAFLRSITPREAQPGKGARWALPGTKADIARYRKDFAAWSAQQDAKRAERAAARAAESAAAVDEVDEAHDAPTDAELDALAEEIMTAEDDAPEIEIIASTGGTATN